MVTVENPHAGQGMVVLDIGGDIGALVLITSPRLDGKEIEICPVGSRGDVPDDGGSWWQGEWRSSHAHPHHRDAAWPHVAVLRRPGGRTEQYAAVFPGLRAGRYDVWLRPDEPIALTVDVVAAQVTTAYLLDDQP